jgi:hypothetical protein
VRPSTADVVGRDVTRSAPRRDWRSDGEVTGGGIVASLRSGIGRPLPRRRRFDLPDVVLRGTPYAAVDLRWPFQKSRGAARRT